MVNAGTGYCHCMSALCSKPGGSLQIQPISFYNGRYAKKSRYYRITIPNRYLIMLRRNTCHSWKLLY